MALLAVNGAPVVGGSICLPRVGAWHADLRVDTPTAITGAVTISIDDGRLQLQGAVARGGEFLDTAHVRIVGGAGGLGRAARAKHYTAASVRVVLSDLLAAAGERLASTAEAGLLARQLPAWTTEALPVGRLITRLLASAAPGAAWRVLPDGSIWAGAETWPAAGAAADGVVLLDEAPERGEMLLGVDSPLLLPGTTIDVSPLTGAGDARRISYIEYRLDETGPRVVLSFESVDAVASDRTKDTFKRLVRAAVGPIDYLALYWAKVVRQAGALIDVQPEDARVPSMAGVPLTTGIPGAQVSMPGGGRVLIGWSGGDPARPYAVAFDGATQALRIVLAARQEVVLGDEASAEPAPKGNALLAYLVNVAAAINAIAPGSVQPPTAALLATHTRVG